MQVGSLQVPLQGRALPPVAEEQLLLLLEALLLPDRLNLGRALFAVPACGLHGIPHLHTCFALRGEFDIGQVLLLAPTPHYVLPLPTLLRVVHVRVHQRNMLLRQLLVAETALVLCLFLIYSS